MNKINEIDNSMKKLMKVTFQPDDDSSKKFASFHRRPQRSFIQCYFELRPRNGNWNATTDAILKLSKQVILTAALGVRECHVVHVGEPKYR